MVLFLVKDGSKINITKVFDWEPEMFNQLELPERMWNQKSFVLPMTVLPGK